MSRNLSIFPAAQDKTGVMHVKSSSNANSDFLISSYANPLKVGCFIIILFFGSLILFSVFAPIEGAVVAQGQLTTSSNTQIIQHLEGGTIKEVLVSNGDFVEAGQKIMELHSASSETNEELLSLRLFSMEVKLQRLMAEQELNKTLVFSDDLLSKSSDSNKYQVLEDELLIFSSRKKSLNTQVDILRSQIFQSENEIKGLYDQIESLNSKYSVVIQELQHSQHLVDNGIMEKSRLFSIQKEMSSIKGLIGEFRSSIARVRQRIAQLEFEIINVKDTFMKSVADDLHATRQSLSELSEQYVVVSDIQNRKILYAPISGFVHQLKFNTAGNIIAPGSSIMDIIPNDTSFIVQATVPANEINNMLSTHEGKAIEDIKAKVRILSLSSRNSPMIEASLISVSPSILQLQTGAPQVFEVKAKLSIDDSIHIPKLYPGTPVIMFIPTVSQTLVSYLFSPIFSFLQGSLRES